MSSFEIDAAQGAIRAKVGVHVALDDDGNGVWVQPASAMAMQGLQDQWRAELRESVRAHAEELGKKPHDLSDEERDESVLRISEDLLAQVSHALRTVFLRWDDGLVGDKSDQKRHYAPDDVLQLPDGTETTAFEMWVRHMAEHHTFTVMRKIIPAASTRAASLEGNSSRPSAGTGATDEGPQPAEGQESTASNDLSAEPPALPAPSAGTSAAPEKPA